MWLLYGSNRVALTVNSAMSLSRLADLGDRDDDELGRFEWCEADDDVHPPGIDLGLWVDAGVADDEEAVRLGPLLGLLEGALLEQRAHEPAHGQPQLGPQVRVVGLEDGELGAEVEAGRE